MARIRRRDAGAVAVISCLCGALFSSPATDVVRGLSLDVLTALRWQAFGPRHDAAAAPAVVLAIDEESYGAPPFKGSPTITWTREIGHVLSALVEGGASSIGFDLVFPTSIEESEIPFGDEAVGARMRGFDRDFLRALHSAAAAGKLVLGEVQHRDQPIRPAAGQRIAVGQQRNIRALNAYNDSDDVVRRLPLSFAVDGQRVPAMAVELAARALRATPEFAADGALTLAGYRVPAAVPGTLTLNFDGGAEDILSYSLSDLRACAEKGDQDYFRRHFEGKVVLLGTLLDTEDRKATSKRFATGLERATAPRCVLPAPAAAGRIKRHTIAGVYVHATAVNNLIRRDAVHELGRPSTLAIAVALAALAGAAVLWLAPVGAALAYLGLAAAYTAAAVFAFRDSLALPLVEPLMAGLAAMVATVGYRFVVTDKDERKLRKNFALYLSPRVIAKMVESDSPPVLGGEMREVTVFFSDIAGFSSFSETMAPQALVMFMNDYLSAMTDIIEAAGGYVDKYVGDSIVAVFGAPLDAPDHACKAVRAALLCRARLEELNRSDAFRGRQISHRIGLNSGAALVGNIGSRRRFNYTAMGDAVNLASRLEGANKYFNTAILVSEMTVARTAAAFAWREIDAIRVKGRAQPVKVFEPLADEGRQTAEQAARSAAYAAGLAAWRSRDFGSAVACFARVAASDPPAALFERRARELAAHPPGPDWEPVNTLEDK
jgi:class 3 adenylate cyclase/CHASE2 domain-containing sensor protein